MAEDVVEVVRCKDCKWFNDSGCAIRIVDDSDKPKENDFCSFAERRTDEDLISNNVSELPSAQITLYGYRIEHLELIARVLQKEDLPPERVAEALMDIGRIVAIVRDELEETLRKAAEQCKT